MAAEGREYQYQDQDDVACAPRKPSPDPQRGGGVGCGKVVVVLFDPSSLFPGPAILTTPLLLGIGNVDSSAQVGGLILSKRLPHLIRRTRFFTRTGWSGLNLLFTDTAWVRAATPTTPQ